MLRLPLRSHAGPSLHRDKFLPGSSSNLRSDKFGFISGSLKGHFDRLTFSTSEPNLLMFLFIWKRRKTNECSSALSRDPGYVLEF